MICTKDSTAWPNLIIADVHGREMYLTRPDAKTLGQYLTYMSDTPITNRIAAQAVAMYRIMEKFI